MGIGERIAVLGCGAIGMMTLLSAKLSGPEEIIITDISPFKREAALKHGAHTAIDPMNEDPVQAVLDLTGGRGLDQVFVAVAQEAVFNQSFLMCRRMGQVVLIASFGGVISYKPRLVQLYERTLIGSSMYTARDYRTAISLWAKGDLAVESMITRRISLDQAPEAVADLAAGGVGDSIKTIITFE
jgi:threonine dehydrogenase-like Zn-dependent dehydrogenase